MKADLHMHTSCSDGIYTPEQLTAMAAAAGLSVIAISDHDTVAAYDGTHSFAAGLQVIRAIEMSSEYEGEDVHILGFYIDPVEAGLQEYCRSFKQRRLSRALEIVDKCISLGYEIDKKAIHAIVEKGGTVGRPHIARILVAQGYFPDVKSVFKQLLYRGGPAYIPYHRRTIAECIAIIHQAGGVAVLAHPGLLHQALQPVLQFPFDGLEVYHPNNAGRYEEFAAIAHKKHWYISGGSDFHGVPGRFPEHVGLYSVDDRQVSRLLHRKDQVNE
jgi:predicted metal-dependent phosphoesterase TrpH